MFSIEKVEKLLERRNTIVREGRRKEQQIRGAKQLKSVDSVWRVNQWDWPGTEWGKDGALKRGMQNQKIEGSIVKQEPCQWVTKFLVRWSIQQGNQRMKVGEVLQQNRSCWVKLKFPRLMLTGKEEKKLNMLVRGKGKLLQWANPRDHNYWCDGRLQANQLLNLPVIE